MGGKQKIDVRNWNRPIHDEIDPSVKFFYRPHNISILLILILGLIYTAYSTSEDHILNLKLGAIASVFTLVIVGLLNFRDGPFIRPHPAIWRVVLSISVVYQLILTILLFQSKHNARHLLSYVDHTLGVPIPAKSYAESCDLSYESIMGQLDIFVLAHTFGWIAKAVVLRDYSLCWTLSVLFEVMEYSLSHQLPNFAECAWDHWILDVLITNWLGIFIGMKICQYFECKVNAS